MRLLWARVGTPLCPNDGTPIVRSSAGQITDTVLAWPEGTRIEVLGPMVRGRKGEFKELFDDLRRQGYVRVRVDGNTVDLGDVPALHRRQNHDIAVVVDRLVVHAADRARLADSIETALRVADGVVEVVRHGAGRGRAPESRLFSERFACPVCGLSLPELEPRQFSFNSPFGACPACHGVGTARIPSADLVLGDARISILEGVVLPWGEPSGYLRKVVLPTLARTFRFDLNAPWGALAGDVRQVLLHGAAGRKLRYSAEGGRGREVEGEWEGILANLSRRYRETSSDAVRQDLEAYMVEQPCPACHGKRLRPESLSVMVAGKSIGDVVDFPIDEAVRFFEAVPVGRGIAGAVDPDIAVPILKEVIDRLAFLRDVGLEYLTLGPVGGNAVGRRGPADPARHPDRLAAGGRALHPRRAEHRAAPARQRAPAGDAARPARPRQHGDRRRARRGHHSRRRPHHRSRAAGRALRRRGRGRGTARRRDGAAATRSPRATCAASCAFRCRRCAAPRDPARQLRIVGARENNLRDLDVEFPLGDVRRGHRRVGLGEVDAGHRHPLPGAGAAFLPRQGRARRVHADRRASTCSTR